MREDQGDAPSDSPAAEAAASPRSDAQDKLLDAFLATDHAFTVDEPEGGSNRSEPPRAPAVENGRSASDCNTFRTCGFAGSIVVAQRESGPNLHQKGRYDKAYDIIHALGLNNPKKCLLCRPIALSAKTHAQSALRHRAARRGNQTVITTF